MSAQEMQALRDAAWAMAQALRDLGAAEVTCEWEHDQFFIGGLLRGVPISVGANVTP